jgi:microcystin degradation protein MlrC
MSPRVFMAALAQETNVFGPLPTGLQSFSGRFHVAGSCARGEPPFPQALRDTLERREVAGHLQWVEGPVAGAHPSGLVTRLAYESLRDQILTELAAAGESDQGVDIVALHLHGAMTADGYPDCEGDLLARIRALVGPAVVVGALLDPHAHLSPAMLESADILVAYKEYPHTDFRERAEELIELLLQAHAGAIRPTAALWDSGVIGVFHTNLPEVRELVERMQHWETSRQALSVSLIHGFPWGDVADLGTRALVICDANLRTAERLAKELAESAQIVATRAPRRTTALDVALREIAGVRGTGRPIVWADSADNPGGGAAGDSTYVLAALLAGDLSHACLGPLWDPAAVDIAFDAGIGARLAMRIGGKTGPRSGNPVDVHAEILALGVEASQTFAGARFPLGRAAAVRCGGVDVVITSQRDQARGTDLFTSLGIDLETKRLIVVKSSQHFYDSYSRIAARIVYLECAGSLQLDLREYPYAHVKRPRWPIDAAPPRPWRVATQSRA